MISRHVADKTFCGLPRRVLPVILFSFQKLCEEISFFGGDSVDGRNPARLAR